MSALLFMVALSIVLLAILLATVTKIGTAIMSAISDFAAKQKDFNDELASDLTAISDAIKALNDKIAALQNSAGAVTPEDQSLIDDLQTKGADLVAQADAMAGKAPPAPPAAPAA